MFRQDVGQYSKKKAREVNNEVNDRNYVFREILEDSMILKFTLSFTFLLIENKGAGTLFLFQIPQC